MKAGLLVRKELEEMFTKSIGTKGTKYYHGMNGLKTSLVNYLVMMTFVA